MSIRVKCECGKTLKVADGCAGETVTCPACGEEVAVPAPVEVSEQGVPRRPRRIGDLLVWTPPQTGLPAFVVLTDDTLYLGPWVLERAVEKAVKRLEQGATPEEVFGSGDPKVPLNTITFVQRNSTLHQVTVNYVVDELQTQSSLVGFNWAAVDGFYEALKQALGPGWTEEKVQQTRLQSAWQPLVAMLVSGVIVPAIICGSVAGGGQFGWPGWCMTAVLVLIFGCSLGWFILNMRNPPLLTNLYPPTT